MGKGSNYHLPKKGTLGSSWALSVSIAVQPPWSFLKCFVVSRACMSPSSSLTRARHTYLIAHGEDGRSDSQVEHRDSDQAGECGGEREHESRGGGGGKSKSERKSATTPRPALTTQSTTINWSRATRPASRASLAVGAARPSMLPSVWLSSAVDAAFAARPSRRPSAWP